MSSLVPRRLRSASRASLVRRPSSRDYVHVAGDRLDDGSLEVWIPGAGEPTVVTTGLGAPSLTAVP